MPHGVTTDPLAIVRRRLREQRLAGAPFERPADVVGYLGAMQAQEYAEAKWSISERTGGLTDTQVEEAFDHGQILRTHVLRPTWHFVTPADIRWLLDLIGPRVHVANGYPYRQLGLDEGVFARSHEALTRELEGGDPRTRRELGVALRLGGVDTEGQRLPYVLMHAELEQLIVSGPRRGKQHTYMLFEQRVPPAPGLTRDEALAELTLRFFRSHGPATAKDFSWWSGLTLTDARAGLEAVGEQLEAVEDEGGTPWFAAPDPPPDADTAGALLIPMYDELGVGYRDLRMVLSEQPPRDGMLSRPIVIGGATVGSWKRTLPARQVVVEATLFTSLGRTQTKALDAVVERFGRFLELPASLEIVHA